jgi:hypothetical protein
MNIKEIAMRFLEKGINIEEMVDALEWSNEYVKKLKEDIRKEASNREFISLRFEPRSELTKERLQMTFTEYTYSLLSYEVSYIEGNTLTVSIHQNLIQALEIFKLPSNFPQEPPRVLNQSKERIKLYKILLGKLFRKPMYLK